MENTFLDNLVLFGLTRIEAQIYSTLLSHGEMTGYEVSKETGVSRSNVYAGLSALVEKGAAYLIEGEAAKYTPVEIKKFTENVISKMERTALELEKQAPAKIVQSTGYITILGSENIRNKIREMLNSTELRLYILAPGKIISEFDEELKNLVADGKKVVIFTDEYKLKGAKVYETKPEEGQIRFITDSAYVLTGELTDSPHDSCLYSGQQNLVNVMKEALKNKIILLEK